MRRTGKVRPAMTLALRSFKSFKRPKRVTTRRRWAPMAEWTRESVSGRQTRTTARAKAGGAPTPNRVSAGQPTPDTRKPTATGCRCCSAPASSQLQSDGYARDSEAGRTRWHESPTREIRRSGDAARRQRAAVQGPCQRGPAGCGGAHAGDRNTAAAHRCRHRHQSPSHHTRNFRDRPLASRRCAPDAATRCQGTDRHASWARAYRRPPLPPGWDPGSTATAATRPGRQPPPARSRYRAPKAGCEQVQRISRQRFRSWFIVLIMALSGHSSPLPDVWVVRIRRYDRCLIRKFNAGVDSRRLRPFVRGLVAGASPSGCRRARTRLRGAGGSRYRLGTICCFLEYCVILRSARRRPALR